MGICSLLLSTSSRATQLSESRPMNYTLHGEDTQNEAAEAGVITTVDDKCGVVVILSGTGGGGGGEMRAAGQGGI